MLILEEEQPFKKVETGEKKQEWYLEFSHRHFTVINL